MDEESKELVEIVVGKMLEPATDVVATAFGIAGLDWLKEVQKRNADKFARKTKKILEERKVKDAAPPSPSILLPLISAAENEGREELLDIWAKLMAAASDPSRMALFRRDYIDIAKQLEPIDAAILDLLQNMNGGHQPTRVDWIAQRLSAQRDQIVVAFQKLASLKLITDTFFGTDVPELAPMGRQFLAVLRP